MEKEILPNSRSSFRRVPRWIWPLVLAMAGAAFTLPALFAALISAGAGHGHYVAARLFFPLPLLLTTLTADTITAPIIVLGCLQFPFYGIVIGCGRGRGMLALAALFLVVHGIGVWLCFAGALKNFY